MKPLEIAKTIQSQIRLTELMAIGAQHFKVLSPNDSRMGGLAFKASLFGRRACSVIIELNHKDLYDVSVLTDSASREAFKDVFCEDLEGVVVSTVEEHFKGK
jgi:hypothetical protein